MADKIIGAKDWKLTTDDFVGEAPPPGASDHKYSAAAKAKLSSINDRVAEQAAAARKVGPR